MINTELILFSENVLRDAETNMMSIINVIESIPSNHFPIVLPSLCIFIYSNNDDAGITVYDCELQISLNKDEIFKKPFRIDFEDKSNNRGIMRLYGLALPSEGKLKASLILDGEVVFSKSIEVIKLNDPDVEISSS